MFRSRPAFRRLACAFLLAWATWSPAVWAQVGPRVIAWRASDGLPQSDVLAVALEPGGQVLTYHGPSLPAARIDGFTVSVVSNTVFAPSRLYVSRSRQRWTVEANGLLEQTDGDWNFHPLPQLAQQSRSTVLRIARPVPLLPLDRNLVLVLLRDQVLLYDATDRQSRTLRRAAETRLGAFREMTYGLGDSALISAERGFLRIPRVGRVLPEVPEVHEHEVPPELGVQGFQRPFEHADGSVVMAALGNSPGERAVVRFRDGRWEAWRLPGQELVEAWGGPDGELWAQTPTAILRYTVAGPELRLAGQTPLRRIRDVAPEFSGITWVGTSDGLFRIAPMPWRVPAGFPDPAGPVYSVTIDRLGRMVAPTADALYRRRFDGWQRTELPMGGAEESAATGPTLHPMQDGSMVAQTSTGTLVFGPGGEPVDLVGTRLRGVPLNTLPDGRLLTYSAAPGPPELLAYDGQGTTNFATLPEEAMQSLGTPSFALPTRTGDLWVGGPNGLLVRRAGNWIVPDQEGTGPEAFAAVELPGRVVFAGRDSVRDYDGRRWRVLRRSTDRVYALMLGRDEELWVASGSGLLRSKDGAWFSFGDEEGIPEGPVFSVWEDGIGRIWAGTARGLHVLDPLADTDPPVASIAGADVPQRAGDTRALFIVGGEDRWRFTPAGRLSFSWRLDNNPWSPWRPAGSVQFTNLTAATHRFYVRGMDPSGNVQITPAVLEFSVSLPWFKDPRLVVASAAVALLLVALALQALVSFARLRRSYAEVERQVAERSAALEKANAELLHSHKMRALGTLAAGVAHDFNNLLSIIKGSAQLLEGQLEDREKARQRLQRIRTAVDQGAGLVRAMLGYSRGAVAPRQVVEVTNVVIRAVRLLEEGLQNRVAVRMPAEKVPPVLVPPEMLQQIVLNLVQNADEAMEQRGRVEVGVTLSPTPPSGGLLNPADAPSYILLTVEDHGIGIPPENLQRIFEPFFTTKGFSSRRGTGLGLSMVYEFAKELGAGLAVESTLGEGSRFTVTIPVPPTPPPPPTDHTPSAAESRKAGGRGLSARRES